jgi:DNA invertase Pin-like site-specific DNA recombinase
MVQSIKNVAIYARVSTQDQSCERQIAELTEYADRCGYTVVANFKEKASGAKNDRAERKKVIQLARQKKIDAVLVLELSRWGRSTEDLLATIRELAERQVALKALNGLDLDIHSAQGKLILTVMSGISEFERDLITERVNSGIAHAQKHGTKTGNPFGRPVFDRAERVQRLLEQGLSVRAVAEKMQISKTTVMKVKSGQVA